MQKLTGLTTPFNVSFIILIWLCTPKNSFGQRYYDFSWPMVAFHPDSSRVPEEIKPDVERPFLPLSSNLSYDPITYTGSLFQGIHGFFRGNLFLDDHTGTHVDAPNHFVYQDHKKSDQLSVGELTLDQLIGPLVFLDMSGRKDKNVSPSDIEVIKDQLQEGAWLIVNFDLAKHYGTASYSNRTTPGFTQQICQHIAILIDNQSINISGIGSDNGSTDIVSNFKNPETSCHGLLLSQRNILLVESMSSLTKLKQESGECEVIVAPMKIMDGSGSPSRVLVRCE